MPATIIRAGEKLLGLLVRHKKSGKEKKEKNRISSNVIT